MIATMLSLIDNCAPAKTSACLNDGDEVDLIPLVMVVSKRTLVMKLNYRFLLNAKLL